MSAMGINPVEMPVNPVYHNITVWFVRESIATAELLLQ